jgi:hypothetical protein
MSTRNRLTNEPSMRGEHKTGVKIPQATRMLARRPSSRRAVTGALSRWRTNFSKSAAAAAVCRHIMVAVLVLPPYGVVLVDTSIEAPGSSRTEDHVRVTGRRAGDVVLITLRIDPGYHVNANPASNEYLIPTTIAFHGVAPERIAYPPATPFRPAFADEAIDVYEGTVVVAASFPMGALDRVHDLGFTVTAQACTKEICLPPNDITGRATW